VAACVFFVDGSTTSAVYGDALIDPTTNPDPSECSHVLLTPQEFEDLNNGPLPPLTIAEANGIAVVIGVLWCVAWIARQLIRSARENS
jgi:hypothetical protein